KSGTPFARAHAASLRARDCCEVLRWALNVPGGCSALHALTAAVNVAALTSTAKLKLPVASGSGKCGTPCARTHSANFTAFSRFVACVLAPLLALPELAPLPVLLPLPVVPVAMVEPQPAPITASKLTRTRTTNGRGF